MSEHGGVELSTRARSGMPFDGDPRAAYALLHDDGAVEHRRVAYDHAASATRVRAALRGRAVDGGGGAAAGAGAGAGLRHRFAWAAGRRRAALDRNIRPA